MSEAQQTSDYPGALDTWVSLTDKEDLAEVSDINKIKNALLAIQTELGADVAGSVADLVTRLAVSLATDGALAKGTSDPGSPVAGQPIYRTDTGKFKIWDGAAWSIIGPTAATKLSTTTISAATNSGDIAITAGYKYKVFVRITEAATDTSVSIRFNSDSGSTDYAWLLDTIAHSTSPSSSLTGDDSDDAIDLGAVNGDGTPNPTTFMFEFDNDDVANVIYIKGSGYFIGGTGTKEFREFQGIYNNGGTDATSFELVFSANTTGNVVVYEFT